MSKHNVLERRLLSRSFDSHERIEELLTTRYGLSGGLKPSIVFKKQETNVKSKGLLAKDSVDLITKNRKVDTRNEMKAYIKKTLSSQKKLIKKIVAHNKKVKDMKSNPFPLTKFLDRYSIPKFEDFATMNRLWQGYMQDLLFTNGQVPPILPMLPKLAAADYHGCLLTVIQSRNTTLVGIRGIVVWDTQHSFILCVPRNEDAKEWNEDLKEFSANDQVGGFKAVPKKGTLFGFDVILPSKDEDDDECIGFTIIGSRFEFRSTDRLGKKFKSHKVDDL